MSGRAAIFDGAARPLRIAERALPERLGPGEVLVEVDLATICGSDLHTLSGRRREATPCILGHEGLGRAVACGAGREAWLGRRITWTIASSCGACPACVEHGLPQKCRALWKVGHAPLDDGCGWNGTYASHLVLRAGTHLVEVPAEIPDAVAAPANCALATVVAVLEELPRSCRRAVIQGAGMLGLYACALLREAGVARVIVVDVEPRRLEHVAAFGGEAALGSALERCEPDSVDLVVELAGDPTVLAEGLTLLRPGGAYRSSSARRRSCAAASPCAASTTTRRAISSARSRSSPASRCCRGSAWSAIRCRSSASATPWRSPSAARGRGWRSRRRLRSSAGSR